jgi:hypothetical protein
MEVKKLVVFLVDLGIAIAELEESLAQLKQLHAKLTSDYRRELGLEVKDG